MSIEGTMMPKPIAIKRFLAYCKRKPSRRMGDIEFTHFQQDVFEIDDPNCKIRMFKKKFEFRDEYRMIVFHSIQDCKGNSYPPTSEMSLTKDEFEMLKNEYLK